MAALEDARTTLLGVAADSTEEAREFVERVELPRIRAALRLLPEIELPENLLTLPGREGNLPDAGASAT